MTLEKLAKGVLVMRDHGFDAIDILILYEVSWQQTHEGTATIMNVIQNVEAASPATIHARIKKLCDAQVLKKITQEDNLRFKELQFGPKYQKLVDGLGRS